MLLFLLLLFFFSFLFIKPDWGFFSVDDSAFSYVNTAIPKSLTPSQFRITRYSKSLEKCLHLHSRESYNNKNKHDGKKIETSYKFVGARGPVLVLLLSPHNNHPYILSIRNAMLQHTAVASRNTPRSVDQRERHVLRVDRKS